MLANYVSRLVDEIDLARQKVRPGPFEKRVRLCPCRPKDSPKGFAAGQKLRAGPSK